MNNKGQVLVIFLLLLPIIIMVFALVIDLGFLMSRTYKVKQTMKQAITYGLETGNIDGTRVMLDKNLEDTYELKENGNLEITVKGSYKTIFGSIFKKNTYDYEFKYTGYIDDSKVVIKEG